MAVAVLRLTFWKFGCLRFGVLCWAGQIVTGFSLRAAQVRGLGLQGSGLRVRDFVVLNPGDSFTSGIIGLEVYAR